PRTEGSSTHVAATNYRLTTNSTSFDIEAPSAGVVVLLEAYLKNDFKVEINSRPSGYFRVNHAFKGVVLPAAGRYRISCTYRPPLFVLGLYLAAGGLLVTIGGFIVARRHDAIFP
ncbi:MAG TPA: hypothetical protein VHF69_02945, partial [Candidatus Synoicihabitans sp.]|nr:hypothetical protein [Candidatus Synoicihabitans sp.]